MVTHTDQNHVRGEAGALVGFFFFDAMVKHSGQNQVRGGKALFHFTLSGHSSSLKEINAGTWGRNYGGWMPTACFLTPVQLTSLYISAHPPACVDAHSRLDPLISVVNFLIYIATGSSD